MAVPAYYVLGFWIFIQFINSMGSMVDTSDTGSGGVAYLAHVGGFVAGLALVKLFARRAAAPAPSTVSGTRRAGTGPSSCCGRAAAA